MDILNFVDVAKLVNRIGTITIPETPSDEEPGHWALHVSTVQVGGITSEVKVLYLYADATMEGTRRARVLCSKANDRTPIQVVYADSLLKKNKAVVQSFNEKAKSVLGLTEYFSSFIRTQTETYVRKVRSLDFKNYVDPHVKVAETFTRKVPNPALSFLLDPDMTGSQFTGTLGVLLGEPGQGKTFMSRYLADACAARKTIPIYVHSEQWSRMQQDELSSLWKTIVHSFRYFESPIGWIDGAEEQFLRVALRTGLFRIIFDGFDEFVLWNKGTVDAIETMRSLQALSDDTGTRILISSRTSFWESEVEDEEGLEGRPRHLFRIQPFDENNAQRYFDQRFAADSGKGKAALQLFRDLRQKVDSKSMEFVGRGFFLFLIADLVERGFSMDSLSLQGRTVFNWMAEALCERERRRQDLSLTARQQLDAISNFAEFVVRGEVPSGETLSLVLQGASELSTSEADALVAPNGKLKDHPLLQRDMHSGAWCFVQEQIRYNLLAERLIELCADSGRSSELGNLVTSSHFDLQLQADVAFSIVEQVFELSDAKSGEAKLKQIIEALLALQKAADDSHTNASSLATAIALLTTNRIYGKGSAHAERAAFLMSMFPNHVMRGLFFFGSLARFDFSGFKFEDSVFHQVSWANCKFSSDSSFVRCRFVGGSIAACNDLGLASFGNTCHFDADAKSIINAEIVRSGRRAYAEDDLRADLNCLISKFIPKDGLGVKTVEARSLERGTIGNSINKEKVIDYFRRKILDQYVLSGHSGTGYQVREEAKPSFIYFSSNAVYTGLLGELFDELAARLL
ncbi:NACHT domain-containing protein [Paraburkholderia sp. Ac-20342]|uniref:NACHT domain-containing protein n=1 Tax=Paraburkholderia sp. Ac-20342 TaxID=2703889 RepID=UPI001981C784|nr:NACHT domain-containing protein [Paraburkholderia sp. Ac-20342]MBN3846984.1 NACHT domain-containing protein [Paraburkholderia sp. Ac-20342]